MAQPPDDIANPRRSSNHGPPASSRGKAGFLWILAAVVAAFFWVQVDVATFRVALEARLVDGAESSTLHVDAAFRKRSEKLQEALLSLDSGPRLRSAIVEEVAAMRRRRDLHRLSVIDSKGNLLGPNPRRETTAPASRPRREGSLRRAGMLGDPGLEIRYLPVSRARGAPVLIGLAPTDLVVGHYWPVDELYEAVERSLVEGGAEEVALAVLNEAGELVYSTVPRQEPLLHLATTTLSSFPGWRLAAFPSGSTFKAITTGRLRRSAALGVFGIGLVVAALGWSRRARGTVPRRDVAAQARPAIHRIGQTEVYLDRFELRRNGCTRRLSSREADLLRLLLEHRGEIVRREDLLDKVWGYAADTETRTLDTFIYRLRRKLEHEPPDTPHLQTIRGVGYKLSDS